MGWTSRHHGEGFDTKTAAVMGADGRGFAHGKSKMKLPSIFDADMRIYTQLCGLRMYLRPVCNDWGTWDFILIIYSC